ncbi:MAG: hypothetical protein IID40_02975 [Planctomycetes bacterium]|nr:hypothetical protein [Planctomycetota bacterium]
MSWQTLIVGLVVGGAGLWLLRRAVAAARGSSGCGCGSGACSGKNDEASGAPRWRELVPLNNDLPPRADKDD